MGNDEQHIVHACICMNLIAGTTCNASVYIHTVPRERPCAFLHLNEMLPPHQTSRYISLLHLMAWCPWPFFGDGTHICSCSSMAMETYYCASIRFFSFLNHTFLAFFIGGGDFVSAWWPLLLGLVCLCHACMHVLHIPFHSSLHHRNPDWYFF